MRHMKAPPPPADSHLRKLKEWEKRRADIVAHREAGWSYGDIATKFGISRSRAHQIFLQEKEAA